MTPTPYALTIDGQRVFAVETAQAINPATEQPICDFPMASRTQLEAAVVAAQKAFTAWSGSSLAERQQMVAKMGDLVEQNYEAFIKLLITEQGKGRAAAEWEVGGSIYWLREIAKQSLEEEVVKREGDDEIVTRHTPIGVIGAITPWNFPLLLAVWKIAPALVAGNTMVLKPSPYTPLCTLWFSELAQQVLPPGVLNTLSGGNELGQWITEHPGTDSPLTGWSSFSHWRRSTTPCVHPKAARC